MNAADYGDAIAVNRISIRYVISARSVSSGPDPAPIRSAISRRPRPATLPFSSSSAIEYRELEPFP
jgi:hypothetical protein